MFYATKIKSVLNGAAIDVNGKRLSFIGYLPVKAGDTVFTDGYVIFGNAPPKGSLAVFDNPSGIPVLADKGSDDKELRGYFDLRGNFKKFKIAGEQWIVNDKKHYAPKRMSESIVSANGAGRHPVYYGVIQQLIYSFARRRMYRRIKKLAQCKLLLYNDAKTADSFTQGRL